LAGAVVTGEGLRAAGAVGFRKWGATNAVTLEDLWHLGSDTKAMTAVLVGHWVEQGRIRWDTRVEEVFADWEPGFHPDARGITVEQLLAHRSGLAPNLDWAPYIGRNDGVREQRLAAARQALAEASRHPPGTHTEYSNLGYVVAGAMLEEVLDRSWERLMREGVFGPLGMDAVGFGGMGTPGRVDQPWGHSASGVAVSANGPEQDNPPVLGPAGRVHASLRSWSLFIRDQLRGARGRPALLESESYRRMQRALPGGEYALGWLAVERDWGEGMVLTHAGCNTMHYAVAWLAPLRDFAVLVCCNQGDAVAARATDEAAGALIRWHLEHQSSGRR
jgi:CubicO group peptidase (beta-lactamase class C family)